MQRLVLSRHGLHLVEVLERQPGSLPDYATVRARVAEQLRQQRWLNAVGDQVRLLAEQAVVVGVDMGEPLVSG